MIRRAAAHVLAAAVIGWLLLACHHCPKPPVVVPPPPVVTVAPPTECIRPERPKKVALWVEAIEDGRLAASQFMWSDIVGYVLAAEARMDADDACLAPAP